MTRFAFAALVSIALFACPSPVPNPDAGMDAGITTPTMDACSGGCGVTQICDTVHRVCVDACGGCGSDGGAGGVCTKSAGGTFSCVPIVVSCAGVTCDQGQVACIADQCSCLGPSRGTFDTCFGDPKKVGAPGAVCSGNTCVNPKQYQQCVTDGAPCPTGEVCNPVFGDTQAVCTRPCAHSTDCDRGEICSNVGCLPSGLFNNQSCAVQYDGGYGADGGNPDDGGTSVAILTVAVGSECLRRDEGGNFTEDSPTGTCTYAFFYLADQGPITFPTCRPPGGALENQDCKQDQKTTAQATQCGGGLECALTRGADLGMCMRTCNALEPTRMYPTPLPQCAGVDAGEVCVNLYRREDINNDGALLGVCAQGCNVFDPVKSQCPMFGTVAASCVPTSADGRIVVTANGDGVCLPQQTTVSALGATCTQSDPYKGAQCATGQLCPPAGPDAATTCTAVCDTGCIPSSDGGTLPGRCATELHATCAGGKTCTSVTTTTAARLGFCL